LIKAMVASSRMGVMDGERGVAVNPEDECHDKRACLAGVLCGEKDIAWQSNQQTKSRDNMACLAGQFAGFTHTVR
jgi:hypothetical protein